MFEGVLVDIRDSVLPPYYSAKFLESLLSPQRALANQPGLFADRVEKAEGSCRSGY